MKLYHLSNNIDEITEFKVKIPRYYDEKEAAVPRVSLSSSIEGCVGATLYTWFEDIKNLK